MTDFKTEKSTERADSWMGSGLAKEREPLGEEEAPGADGSGTDDSSSPWPRVSGGPGRVGAGAAASQPGSSWRWSGPKA